MGLIKNNEKIKIHPKKIKRHLKNKKKVLKLFPGAFTKATKNNINDPDNEFYVVDANGYRILKDEYSINSKTIFDAWKAAAAGLYVKNIIDVNNKRFDDEQIFKRFLQKMERDELISKK